MTSSIDRLMEAAIEQGAFPGGTLLFAKGEETLKQGAYGSAELETRFDVSSLSKVMATTAIAMRLVEQSVLSLEANVTDWLSEWENSPYKSIQVTQLLSHTSGFPAYRPYFEKLDPESTDAKNRERSIQYLRWIAAETPEAPAGTQHLYSDLGFIALGILLERASGSTLRELFEKEICLPLKLSHSSYGSLKEGIGVAMTEEDPWRGRLLCGEVHDENAFALGGAAGHAGVFTTLGDCHIFAREVCRAWRGKSSWLTADTLQRFLGKELKFCLGWDRPSRPHSQAGRYFSEKAVGHLGFTGCSLWIELDREIVALLLTNRVHPNRSNEQIKEFRPKIHDALFRHFLHS